MKLQDTFKRCLLDGLFFLMQYLLNYSNAFTSLETASENSGYVLTYDQKQPKIVIPPQNVTVIANEQIVFICVSEGNPQPTATWKINDKPKLPERYRVIRNSVLHLTSAQVEDDGAVVTCIYRNVMGSDERTAYVKVFRDKHAIPNGFPVFTGKSSIVVSQKNSNVTLECPVIAQPEPKIIWLKNFYPVEIKKPRIEMKNFRNLFISKTLEGDSGKYQCLASNEHGNMLSPVISLMIRISRFSPHFVFVTPDQYITAGSSVKLKCTGDGSPTPIVYWICGNTKLTTTSLDPDSNFIEVKGSITTVLSDISESINCTCVAKGKDEVANHTIHIIVKNIPAAPKVVRISSISTTTCLVTWKYPLISNVPISSFTIFYIPKILFRKKQPLSITIDTVNKDQQSPNFETSSKLVDLAPFTEYSIWMVTNGGEGVSEPSEILNFQTEEAVPSSSPRNLTIIQTSEDSVILRWYPPLEANGRIKQYPIYYTVNKALSFYQWIMKSIPVSQISSNKEITAEINFLQRNSVYYFRVGCVNTVGSGPPTDVFSKSINDDDIYRLHNVSILSISATFISISWRPNVYSKINQFKVQYTAEPNVIRQKRKGNYRILQQPIGNDSVYFIMLYDLIPNTIYVIDIFPIVNGELKTPTKLKERTRLLDANEGVLLTLMKFNSVKITVLDSTLADLEVNIQWNQFFAGSKLYTSKCYVKPSKRNCIISDLKSNTVYKMRISYMGFEESYYFQTHPEDLKAVFDLKLALDCQPDNPCITASWKYEEGNDAHFQVSYYPLNVPEQTKNLFTYNFNITKTSFTTDPKTHVLGTTVEFFVGAVNQLQSSDIVSAQIIFPEGVPVDYPRNLQVHTKLFPDSILLTWDSPSFEILHGTLRCTDAYCYDIKTSDVIYQQNSTENEMKIPKHHFRQHTFCKTRFWTAVGAGPWSPSVLVDYYHVEVLVPPIRIRSVRKGNCCLKITWLWQQNFSSVYSHFKINVTESLPYGERSEIFKTKYPSSLFYMHDIPQENKFSIQVQSVSLSQESSPLSPAVIPEVFDNSWDVVHVNELTCVIKSSRQIILRWHYNSITKTLIHFRINFTGTTNFQSKSGKLITVVRDERENSLLFKSTVPSVFEKSIGSLFPHTSYEFEVEPIVGIPTKVWTNSKTVSCKTDVEPPTVVPRPTIAKIDRNNSIIHLLIDQPSYEYGSVVTYYLLVAKNYQLSRTAADNKASLSQDSIKVALLTRENKTERFMYIAAQIEAPILMKDERYGSTYAFPLGNGEQSHKYIRNKPLETGTDYQAVIVACVKTDFTEDTFNRSCSISDWSDKFNTVTSLPHTGNSGSSETNNLALNGSLTEIIITAIFIPIILCGALFLTIFVLRKHHTGMRIFEPCFKLRPNNTDYFTTSNSDLKENLVNPLIASSTAGSYCIQNHNSLELTRYQISQTPDLLVQSSPTTSFRTAEKIQKNPEDHSVSKYKVPIGLLHEYICNQKTKDNAGFSAEFESIDHAHEFTWTNSNKSENKTKNRYANIVAYDHSRVVLQNSTRLEGHENNSDYINANYINGYRKQNAYIATQGPLPETVCDFWHMVWEQRSVIIIMLTQLTERSRTKCEQYWPKGGRGSQSSYSGISVTLTSVQILAYFVCRCFTVQKIGYPEKREIKHFQFTAWPDHGIPQSTIPFHMFIMKIKKEILLESGPVVVHCSAGVGRTGVFIAVDAILEQLKHEKCVDIYSYITHIRCQRNFMVQTEDQYIFIYEVVLDHLQSINTEISSAQLYGYIEKLSKIDIEKFGLIQMTGFQIEYRRLLRWSSLFSHIAPSTKSECSTKSSDSFGCQQDLYNTLYETALLTINQSKNRNTMCLPPDISRVLLRPIKTIEGSDYINASWVDGYSLRKAYIATQCPLSETTEDFWRMLWENECSLIVTLNDIPETYQFWPKDRSVRYQFFVVDPVAEYGMQHFSIREFKLTDARDGQTRTIRQFHYIEWIDDTSIPTSSEGFLDLIVQVKKTKGQFGNSGPVCAHCSTGSIRTGTFIALSILMDKMKLENSVNVFDTFKLVKWQRPSLIDGEDQYQFCYAALLDYLTLYSDEFSKL